MDKKLEFPELDTIAAIPHKNPLGSVLCEQFVFDCANLLCQDCLFNHSRELTPEENKQLQDVFARAMLNILEETGANLKKRMKK